MPDLLLFDELFPLLLLAAFDTDLPALLLPEDLELFEVPSFEGAPFAALLFELLLFEAILFIGELFWEDERSTDPRRF